MNSASSSGSKPRPPAALDALRNRVGAFRDETLGDLAVDRGWITESQLGECLEAADTAQARLPVAALLVQRGSLTAEQAEQLQGKVRTAEMGDYIARAATSTPHEAQLLAADP